MKPFKVINKPKAESSEVLYAENISLDNYLIFTRDEDCELVHILISINTKDRPFHWKGLDHKTTPQGSDTFSDTLAKAVQYKIKDGYEIIALPKSSI